MEPHKFRWKMGPEAYEVYKFFKTGEEPLPLEALEVIKASFSNPEVIEAVRDTRLTDLLRNFSHSAGAISEFKYLHRNPIQTLNFDLQDDEKLPEDDAIVNDMAEYIILVTTSVDDINEQAVAERNLQCRKLEQKFVLYRLLRRAEYDRAYEYIEAAYHNSRRNVIISYFKYCFNIGDANPQQRSDYDYLGTYLPYVLGQRKIALDLGEDSPIYIKLIRPFDEWIRRFDERIIRQDLVPMEGKEFKITHEGRNYFMRPTDLPLLSEGITIDNFRCIELNQVKIPLITKSRKHLIGLARCGGLFSPRYRDLLINEQTEIEEIPIYSSGISAIYV